MVPWNSLEGKTTVNCIFKSNLSNTIYPEATNSLATSDCSVLLNSFHEQCKALSSEGNQEQHLKELQGGELGVLYFVFVEKKCWLSSMH